MKSLVEARLKGILESGGGREKGTKYREKIPQLLFQP